MAFIEPVGVHCEVKKRACWSSPPSMTFAPTFIRCYSKIPYALTSGKKKQLYWQ